MESILVTIKEMLGPSAEYEEFDPQIITHINSVFMILTQMGVGPAKGFTIEDDTATWIDFIGEDTLLFEAVKSYVYMKVRLIFDPPTASAHMEAIKRNIDELEWRLSNAAETKEVSQNE